MNVKKLPGEILKYLILSFALYYVVSMFPLDTVPIVYENY